MKLIAILLEHKHQFLTLARKRKYVEDIEKLQIELKIKKGQLVYVMEYLKNHPCKFVKQGDVLHYCDKRRCEDTNGNKPNFKDNSRAIEILRKDKTPLRWLEVSKNGELYFMYCKSLETNYVHEIVEMHARRKENFSKDVVSKALSNAGYKCQMCGISANQVKLQCDHWLPREQCGHSTVNNAVCLCSNCNPKKNACLPAEWFCKHFLTNFNKISLSCGDWCESKKLIEEYLRLL
jgi:hypothetical protein